MTTNGQSLLTSVTVCDCFSTKSLVSNGQNGWQGTRKLLHRSYSDEECLESCRHRCDTQSQLQGIGYHRILTSSLGTNRTQTSILTEIVGATEEARLSSNWFVLWCCGSSGTFRIKAAARLGTSYASKLMVSWESFNAFLALSPLWLFAPGIFCPHLNELRSDGLGDQRYNSMPVLFRDMLYPNFICV